MAEADNRFVSPRQGLLGSLENAIANAGWLRMMRRSVMSRLPFPVLESDVRDVVYANWVVEVSALRPWIPDRVEVLERSGKTILTVLTYVHGGFGPAILGTLRRHLPSPLQSNWRLYVTRIDGVEPRYPTVLFLKNIFDSPVHALGTRVFSDALPSHVAGIFRHEVNGATIRTEISGSGSAPSIGLSVQPGSQILSASLDAFHGAWGSAVEALALQDAAVAAAPDRDDLAWAQIDLPIDLTKIQPLEVVDYRPDALLRNWGATETPFCFLAPKVRFRVLAERTLTRGGTSS